MDAMKTQKFRNESSDTIYLAPPFDCKVKAGGELDVPEHLCKPFRYDNGGRRPSVIECLAPQMKPVDKAYAAEWSKAPPETMAVARGSKPASLSSLLAAGVPRGVAEAIVKAQAAQASGRDGE